MNSIVPLNSLVARLALNQNLSEEEARRFVTQFFTIVEHTLAEGQNVTIKGLGTFEVINRTATFTPDPAFASAANAPFEMFTPVILADDFDSAIIDDIDTDESNQPVTATSGSEEDAISDDSIQTATDLSAPSTPVIDNQIDEHTVSPEVATVETVSEPIEDHPDESTEETSDSETAESVEVRSEESVETQVEETVFEPINQRELPETDFQEEVPSTDTNVGESRRRISRCCVALWSILGLFAGLAGGIILGYYGHDRISRLFDYTSTPMARPDTTAIIEKTSDHLTVDTMPVNITDLDIIEINQPDSQPAEQTATSPSATDTGQPKFDTVTRTRFLTTMAREYYGSQQYWVYIYQANSDKLGHPDYIKPGTQVRIPEFDEFRTSTDKKKNWQNARQLAFEIYARYTK